MRELKNALTPLLTTFIWTYTDRRLRKLSPSVVFPVLELELIAAGAVDDGGAGEYPGDVRPLLSLAAGEEDDGGARLVALVVGGLFFGSVRVEVFGGAVAEALKKIGRIDVHSSY